MGRPRIFFSAGEPSGDLHAARLIERLLVRFPAAEFCGLGGQSMQKAGCNLLYPLTDMAVVGFVEVLPKLRQFFRVADLATRHFDRHPPDAVVLIDFPGFNWHIAKRAKQRGIPVFYYLPPQLWAWGQWRVRKMRKYVDHVLCNLPFEQRWYESRRISSHLVGHPFFDEVKERRLDKRFVDRWRNPDSIQVAVLPGSRAREVENIWPMQLSIIRELSKRHPRARFMVACLKDSHCVWCKRQLCEQDQHLNINFFVGKTSEVIHLADCSLMKSGSVSLEMMARGVPSVVVYHVGRVFYNIARRLTDLTTFSLPNLLADQTVMKEFLAVGNSSSAAKEATEALDHLLSDSHERIRQKHELLNLSNRFAQHGASEKAADFIHSKVQFTSTPNRLSA